MLTGRRAAGASELLGRWARMEPSVWPVHRVPLPLCSAAATTWTGII